MEALLNAARWLLIAVLSIKAGEAYSGQAILPQNPLDLTTLVNNLLSLDTTTLLVILGVFFFFLILIIAIKKRRRQPVQQIIYVPVQSYLPKK